MKKLIIILLIILAIILILLVGGGIYAYLNLKPFLTSTSSTNANQTVINRQTSGDKHPLLTPAQEATLEKIGIDPAKLPTTITPAMEDCFIEKLGANRVEAIKTGQESPNPIDFFKAKSCL